ncbi:hypothetical protein CY34DRAFT_162473 [Suillus luteus UH-Slu-Lm8-n1]|uniref:Uncharacterized protein n=1 Tax=Suillus luteus UH-Slu-Lm8-n1 TaxID=930992 RepID=A0A0D0AW62_9AGAM|nr:hypothetical protein CY34DRAFT_162473 [Suillus luteus UH-Slu-Lm8-n1]
MFDKDYLVENEDGVIDMNDIDASKQLNRIDGPALAFLSSAESGRGSVCIRNLLEGDSSRSVPTKVNLTTQRKPIVNCMKALPSSEFLRETVAAAIPRVSTPVIPYPYPYGVDFPTRGYTRARLTFERLLASIEAVIVLPWKSLHSRLVQIPYRLALMHISSQSEHGDHQLTHVAIVLSLHSIHATFHCDVTASRRSDLGLLSYFAHCLKAFIMPYINDLGLLSSFASTLISCYSQ